MKNNYRIGFINQSTGRLFKDLVEDLNNDYFPSVLYTGNDPGVFSNFKKKLIDVSILTPYNRQTNLTRLLSGIKYILKLFFRIMKSNHQLLFIVSNPPFIGVIGPLLKLLRNQKYVILVYDIYPDVLINVGRYTDSNLVIKLWRYINKKAYDKAEIVFTIGDGMKQVLNKHFESNNTSMNKVTVIPNCADPKHIKPIAKENNRFSKKYSQLNKLSIMYSGNFGNTHSFDIILNVAKKLHNEKLINFFLIGEGSQKKYINSRINNEKISNVISLPFQNESTFPEVLASADLSLITMAKGTERLMVPGKIYYSMAAGSALIGIAHDNSELAKIIINNKCGIVISPDNEHKLIDAILKFKNSPKFLNNCKNNSYLEFKNSYTRSHMSKRYSNSLNQIFNN